jgi:hypothetical protein
MVARAEIIEYMKLKEFPGFSPMSMYHSQTS